MAVGDGRRSNQSRQCERHRLADEPGPELRQRVSKGLALAISATAKLTKANISANHHSANFTFKAIGAATGSLCALVKTPAGKRKKPKPNYRSFRSPTAYKNLGHRRYRFLVRALNGAIPGKAASKAFTI